MNRLNRELRDDAVAYGMCPQWQSEWNDDKTQQELLDMYVRALDFCIEHDYHTVAFIKEHVDPYLRRKNRIYVDEEVEGGESGIYMVNGKCRGEAVFDDLAVATLYVRHDSELCIVAKGLSKIFVRVYDRARIHVTQSDMGKVYVYVCGEECAVECEGDVMMRTSRV